MRRLPRPSLLLSIPAILLASCASAPQEVLPIPRAIIGASRIEAVELVLQPAAGASVAALDERATKSGGDGPARQPLRTLLETAVRDAAQRAGLTSGRALRLVVDLDVMQVQGTGAALFGQADRMAGTVYLRDPSSGAPLGQLYIDVGGANAGPIGLALRGSGVRERLVASFAQQIADALSGRRPPR